MLALKEISLSFQPENAGQMTTFSRERLSCLYSLARSRPDILSGRPFAIDPASLRFRHGETIADLKIPYHMGGEDENAIEAAILALAALLRKRFDPRPAETDPAVLVSVPALKDKTFRTDIFISDSLEKKIAAETIKCVPFMDSSILSAWLSPEGQGRAFIRWAGLFLEKMLRDEAQTTLGEPTVYLSLLSVINTVRKKKEKIRQLRIKGVPYERADLAIGLTLYIALSQALKGTFARLKAAGASCYSQKAEEFALSALEMRPFTAIPSSILSSSLNPYAINSTVYESLSRHLVTARSFPDVQTLAAAAGADGETLEVLRLNGEVARFREEAAAYLFEFDSPGQEASDAIHAVYNDDRLIRNLLSDPKAAGALIRSLDSVKERYARDAKRAATITGFQEYLSGFRKGLLSGLLRTGKKEEERITPAVEGFLACVFDETVERYESAMRACLADRRAEFSQAMLLEEYGRGRLYRFSSDDRPVLKALAAEEEGQLFIDMKDFTRKTLKVKEIAMADFMKDHFYNPITAAAARYAEGSGVTHDERGIKLVNIPGDAAIFSGGVSRLVSLARDIQSIVRRYREHLLRKLPPSNEDELLEEVHKRFEGKRAALRLKRAELQEALRKGASGVEAKLAALGEEEHKLEQMYRDELEAAIKGELEAGLYIAYGAKAEITVVDAPEGLSGPVKVSIGEKINESARGTFRNANVRAKLELALEGERLKRNDKTIKYPFDVCVDRVYSIKLPPEVESALESLAAGGGAERESMARTLSDEFREDLKKLAAGEPFSSLRLVSTATDIYNKGQALSEGALKAYIKERRGNRWFFERTVKASELAPPIQKAFFFPKDTLEFTFGHEHVKGTDSIDAFVKSGEVIFKGFEANGPVSVFEMLDTEGEFFKALLKNHFWLWLEESKSGTLERLPTI